jgi:hypothetical protein
MKNLAVNSGRLIFALTISLVLASCSSGPPKPVVDYKHDYDFTKVTKVAFYQNSGQVSGDNPMQLSDMQRGRIDRAIEYALVGKGFMQVVDDPKDADLLISWHLVTQHKTDVRSYQSASYGGYHGGYGGYNRYSAYNCWSCAPTRTEVSVQNYTQGTFIVDMIDQNVRQSVWRGTTQSKLKGDPSEGQEAINEAAVVIFADFPPL